MKTHSRRWYGHTSTSDGTWSAFRTGFRSLFSNFHSFSSLSLSPLRLSFSDRLSFCWPIVGFLEANTDNWQTDLAIFVSCSIERRQFDFSLSSVCLFFYKSNPIGFFFFFFIRETRWAGKATHGKVKCNSLFPTRHLVTHGSHSVWLERCIYSDSDFSFEGLWSLLFSTQSAPIAMYSHERCRGAWKSLCRSRSRPKKATIFFFFSWIRWLYGAHSLAVAGKKKKKKKSQH